MIEFGRHLYNLAASPFSDVMSVVPDRLANIRLNRPLQPLEQAPKGPAGSPGLANGIIEGHELRGSSRPSRGSRNRAPVILRSDRRPSAAAFGLERHNDNQGPSNNTLQRTPTTGTLPANDAGKPPVSAENGGTVGAAERER